MDEFVKKSYNLPGMARAHRFAEQHRALGVGVLGYHSYFQYKRVEIESLEAKQLNHQIFKTLKERTEIASNIYS